jgi:hypothetical protein
MRVVYRWIIDRRQDLFCMLINNISMAFYCHLKNIINNKYNQSESMTFEI